MQVMHPPRPRLVLRVGVCGHRPAGLAGADDSRLRAETRRALSLALEGLAAARSDAFSDERALLRVVTSLAEGADRLVAEEALALAAVDGPAVELQCPLPFFREEYRKDFSPPGQTRFDELLAAHASLELDGSRADQRAANEAYLTAGRVMLDHADLLVALWDGAPARGQGGTGEVVAEGVHRGLPTIWIHAEKDPPHAACLAVKSGGAARCGEPLTELRSVVAAVLQPPAARQGSSHDLRAAFFAESQPRWTPGFLWRLFRDVVGKGFPGLPSLRVRELKGAFGWADGLADYYANLYRSSFLTNYLLGGVAVLFAVLPMALGWTDHEHPMHESHAFVTAELAVILAVLVNTVIGIRRRWHERWIDYRLLAEYLRQIRLLAPLGRLPVLALPSAGVRPGDARGTWMYWYARAQAREAGLASGRLDAAALASYAALLEAHLKDQEEYQESTAKILGRVDRRLARAGLALFVGTLVACALHFRFHSAWLTLLSAVLPALGASLAGVRSHAELEIVVRRAEGAREGLARLHAKLSRRAASTNSRGLAAVSEAAAVLMIEDTLSWRLVSESRPLELAG
jgi:hypothetical protein